MATCNYCKSKGEHTGKCRFCGKQVCAFIGGFVFGPSESDMRPVEFILTDKYILIREISAVAQIQGVNSEKNNSYAFYDLCEIAKVIYPCYTKRFGKSPVFRFVNVDGTDFVLSLGLVPKALDKLAQTFVSVGLTVETGTKVYDTCCEKPFVDFNSCVNRVCISAAQFVKFSECQFVAPSVIPTMRAEETPVAASIVDWSSEWEKTVSDIAEPPVELGIEEEPALDTASIVDWSSEWEKTVSDIAQPPVELEIEEEPVVETPSIIDWSSEWEKTVSDISEPPVELEIEEEPVVETPSIVDWSSEWEKTVSDIAQPPVELEAIEEPAVETPSIIDWSSEWEKTVSDITEPPVELEVIEESAVETPLIVDWSSEWEKTVSNISEAPVTIKEDTIVPMDISEWKKLWELE